MKNAKENLSLVVALAVMLCVLMFADHNGLPHKWHTAIFGTVLPFWVAVARCPLRWGRWSFWASLAICLFVHLLAISTLFHHLGLGFAPGWGLWVPVAFAETFALIAIVRRMDNKLSGRHRPLTVS